MPAKTCWKLRSDEVPAELADNLIVEHLANLSPEEEESLERAEELDEALSDDGPDDR